MAPGSHFADPWKKIRQVAATEEGPDVATKSSRDDTRVHPRQMINGAKSTDAQLKISPELESRGKVDLRFAFLEMEKRCGRWDAQMPMEDRADIIALLVR